MIETNKKHKGAQENQRGQWQALTGSCRWWGWSCVSYWTLLVQNGMCQTYITTAHGRIRCSFFQRNITKGTFTILLIDNRPRRCVLNLTVTLLSAFSSFCRIRDYYGIGGASCHEKRGTSPWGEKTYLAGRFSSTQMHDFSLYYSFLCLFSKVYSNLYQIHYSPNTNPYPKY